MPKLSSKPVVKVELVKMTKPNSEEVSNIHPDNVESARKVGYRLVK